jgi:site-specific recombinase XerD
LSGGRNAETLFLNQVGKPMRADQVETVIGRWTTRFAGVRTTPHLFRDAVAFKWLKEHPKDYLTLSKMLWHKNMQTTVQI